MISAAWSGYYQITEDDLVGLQYERWLDQQFDKWCEEQFLAPKTDDPDGQP